MNTADTSRAPGVSQRWIGRHAPWACWIGRAVRQHAAEHQRAEQLAQLRDAELVLGVARPHPVDQHAERLEVGVAALALGLHGVERPLHPDTANIVGSVTSTARCAAASALRVSWPSEGGQSTITSR